MKHIILSLLTICLVTSLSAQTGLLGYGSKAVVPTIMANPAMVGNVRSHIAFPIISSIQLEQNTSFKISDWILKEEGKTYISPNKFAANALARNDMNTNVGIDIFSVGFSIKDKNYFSLGYQHFSTIYASFSDDLIKFLAEGNANNPNVNLNEESIYINQFNAAYLGYARSLMDDKLNIGFRVKMLQGFGNLQTNNVNFNITTDANASPAYAVNVAGSMQAQAGGLFGVLMDTLNNNTAQTVMDNLTGMGKGVGFDFGASYKVTDKLTVSASAINVGNITWKKDFTQKMDLTGTGKFEFSGIKTNLSSGSNGNAADSVEQKFKEAFKVQRTKGEYASALPTMLYASASYKINAKNQASAVFRTQSFNGKSNNVLGVNYAYSPLKAIQLLAGANMANFKSVSFGAGMVANLGTIQLHVLADNISGLLAVDNTNRLQIQAGINVVLKKKDATPATPAPTPTPTETPNTVAIAAPLSNGSIINEIAKRVVVTAKGIIEKTLEQKKATEKAKIKAETKENTQSETVLKDECGDAKTDTEPKNEEEVKVEAVKNSETNECPEEESTTPTATPDPSKIVSPKTIMATPVPEVKATIKAVPTPVMDLPKKDDAKKKLEGY